jgi:heterodisulfide reductase subunit C
LTEVTERGPLPFVILSATGEDLRRCSGCAFCEPVAMPGMDLTLPELMQAAARNDLRVLTSETLWACEPILRSPPRCQQEIDIPQVIRALRQEAVLRGLTG